MARKVRKRSDFGNMLHEEFLAPNITQKKLAEESKVVTTILSDMVTGERFAYDQTLFDDLFAIFEALSRLGVSITEDKVTRLLATIDKNHLSPARQKELLARLKRELIIKQTYLTKQGLPLIGRERYIQTILSKLQDEGIRFLTLTGPAGVGKTELARQIEHVVQKEGFFANAVFVSLEGVSNVQEVNLIIDEHLKDISRQEKMLLILDNCEDIQDTIKARDEIFTRLEKHELLTVLATSRARFSIEEYRIFPLRLPGKDVVEIEELLAYDAVRLFFVSVRNSGGNYPPKEYDNLIAPICIALDGLPLALKIAGSLVKDLGIMGIYDRILDKKIQEITYDFPESKRHESLEKLFQASYNLLNEQEKMIFRRITVFKAHFHFLTAAVICNMVALPTSEPHLLVDILKKQNTSDMINIFKKLSNHNLIIFQEGYARMAHITIRDYALRQLGGEEEKEIRKQYLDFFYMDWCVWWMLTQEERKKFNSDLGFTKVQSPYERWDVEESITLANDEERDRQVAQILGEKRYQSVVKILVKLRDRKSKEYSREYNVLRSVKMLKMFASIGQIVIMNGLTIREKILLYIYFRIYRRVWLRDNIRYSGHP